MKHFFLSMVLIMTSCGKYEVAKYVYNKTIVTRVDTDGESMFYYGDCENDNCPDSFIKVSYSGFNSGLSGLIVFHDNRKVELVSLGGGYFDVSMNQDSMLYMMDYENPELNNWLDSIKGNYDNVAEVTGFQLEKELNRKNKSKVTASYHNMK